MPAFSADHAPLLEYLRNLQLIGTRDVRVKNEFAKMCLDAVREVFTILENHLTVFSLFIAAFVVIYTKKMFFSR